tara:strand:+ start:3837 stop:4004 length:168 start_codon:yes stop_codon:yes gene_type:complete
MAVGCFKTRDQVKKQLDSGKVKNVIMIVGDGMEPQQVGLAIKDVELTIPLSSDTL